jgi:hypothetical protein
MQVIQPDYANKLKRVPAPLKTALHKTVADLRLSGGHCLALRMKPSTGLKGALLDKISGTPKKIYACSEKKGPRLHIKGPTPEKICATSHVKDARSEKKHSPPHVKGGSSHIKHSPSEQKGARAHV